MSEWDVWIPLALTIGPFTAIVVGSVGALGALVGLVDRRPPTFSVAFAALWLPARVIWLGASQVLAPFWAFDVGGIDAVNMAALVPACAWLVLAVARTRFAPG